MKLADVKAGDTLIVDRGFSCLRHGPHHVREDESGDLFLECKHGQHFLRGQEDQQTGELIGLAKAESRTP